MLADPIYMPIKVLQKEGNELKLRFEGESHTSLELFRAKLDENKSIEYVNFFPGHPNDPLDKIDYLHVLESCGLAEHD